MNKEQASHNTPPAETPHELAARIVAEYAAYDWGMAPANELKLARALLSSPRVEGETRRKALEEAAKAVEAEAKAWTGREEYAPAEVALENAAAAIRALLSPQGE